MCQKIALVKLLEELKAHSSKWMKSKDVSLKDFYWQGGYGAFSVNPSEVDIAAKYIENQHQHHQKMTFQEEYRAFLKRYNVPFDEQYVWD